MRERHRSSRDRPRWPWKGDWRDAVIWTAALSLTAGLMRLMAGRVR